MNLPNEDSKFWEVGGIYQYAVFVSLSGFVGVNHHDLFICTEIVNVPHKDSETKIRLVHIRSGRIYSAEFAASYFQRII